MTPEYKFCDDGKVILKNPETLSQRYRDTTPPAQPAPVQEPVAWVLLREDEDGFEPIQFYGGREKPETVGELKSRFTLRPVCFADTAPPAAHVQDSDHEFKNFHRLLCERFGYTHDEVDWKRDQISLIEWIAKQVKPAAPVQEPESFEDWHSANYVQTLEKYGDSYKNMHVRNRWQGWLGAKSTPPAAQRQWVTFPRMLRKMWSGGEVQAWLDENVNKENT